MMMINESLQVDPSLHKITLHNNNNEVAKDLHCSSRVFRKPPCKMVRTMGHKVIPHFESTLYAEDQTTETTKKTMICLVKT